MPELPGCPTQAKTVDKLIGRIKEAISAYLEAEGVKPREAVELIGFQLVEVATYAEVQIPAVFLEYNLFSCLVNSQIANFFGLQTTILSGGVL